MQLSSLMAFRISKQQFFVLSDSIHSGPTGDSLYLYKWNEFVVVATVCPKIIFHFGQSAAMGF